MVPLKRGGLRAGQWYLGINRRKAVVWPTRSVVAAVEPGRRLVWDTKSSGAQWIWELEAVEGGTRVVHRRPVPKAVTLLSKAFAPRSSVAASSMPTSSRQGMAARAGWRRLPRRSTWRALAASRARGCKSAVGEQGAEMPWLRGSGRLGSAT